MPVSQAGHPGPLLPLDASAPVKVETATFALG